MSGFAVTDLETTDYAARSNRVCRGTSRGPASTGTSSYVSRVVDGAATVAASPNTSRGRSSQVTWAAVAVSSLEVWWGRHATVVATPASAKARTDLRKR